MQSVTRIIMKTSTLCLSVALALWATLGSEAPRAAEAGVIPWSYNAVFGYGPIFPRRYGYTAGYAPMYGTPVYSSPMGWGANYGPGSAAWTPQMAPVTTYYGPAYYGGGVVNAGCGCNPCGYSACDPCAGNCPGGDCSTNTSTYSPDPQQEGNGTEVTPTFKPTPVEETRTPETADDFVPVERREEDTDFISPRSENKPETGRSTIPDAGSPSTIPNNSGSSTIPDRTEILPGQLDPEVTPMAPITRPVVPSNGSTIPDASSRSTIPNGGTSTIPNNNTLPNRPFPGETDAPEFRPPVKPAPVEPSSEEILPVIPSVNLKPLEIQPAPAAALVVERKRISVKVGYRPEEVSRISVPSQPVLESGASRLAIR